ncbi:hypothetical protein NBRC116493_13620 [Aurantivibrio infirmus]
MESIDKSTPQLDSTKPEKIAQNRPKTKPNRRSWVSITLFVVLLGMTITGIMSYLFAYDADTAGIHTWFGLSFIVLMFLHLTNNGRSLINYTRMQRGKRYIAYGSTLVLLLTLGVYIGLPPFTTMLEFGQNLRKSATLEEGTYQTLTTRIGEQGRTITIDLRAGEHYQSPPQPLFLGLTFTTVPQVAFWLEDMDGNYIETLYVTKKSTNAGFKPAEDPFGTVARPEALPYWAHKRGVQYNNELMVPDENNTDLDSMTGPTPLGNYDVVTKVDNSLRQFRVLMEINRSFDFNDYYTPDRYPDDPVYSGSGSSGQPSVIYAAEVNLDDNQTAYFLKAIGHGHYSGQDGQLYTDMEGMDSALQLVKRVVVDVE